MEAGGGEVHDLDQFEDLFVREYPAIFRSAYLVVGDRDLAREITQEAFSRLLLRWNRVRRYDRPGAWVRLVAVRLARRTRDRRVIEASALTCRELAVEGPSAVRLDVDTAILQLPRAQRAAVVLFYLDDLPIDEVAAALRCRPATARVHLHRARARLAELLGEEVVDDD
jgi:RNA polymerase sigma factor (sigma-70 family)